MGKLAVSSRGLAHVERRLSDTDAELIMKEAACTESTSNLAITSGILFNEAGGVDFDGGEK